MAAHPEHIVEPISLQSAAVHLILGRDRSRVLIDAAVLLSNITLVYHRTTAGGILQTASGNESDKYSKRPLTAGNLRQAHEKENYTRLRSPELRLV